MLLVRGLHIDRIDNNGHYEQGEKMKAIKKNRLRMLVAQRSITQSQANQLWRDYLRLFKRVQSNQRGMR